MIQQSVITCPHCATAKTETMPTNACQFFYECTSCGAMLRPKSGDCCVFCTYGSMPCPPISGRARGKGRSGLLLRGLNRECRYEHSGDRVRIGLRDQSQRHGVGSRKHEASGPQLSLSPRGARVCKRPFHVLSRRMTSSRSRSGEVSCSMVKRKFLGSRFRSRRFPP